MKIKLEQNPAQTDIEVLIRYAQMSRSVIRLEAFIQSFDRSVKCYQDNTETWIKVSDIFYIESVDKRSFLYCEKNVYRSELRLYQLLDALSDFGFVQISKSCILNINVLECVHSLKNSRMEALLTNGEKVNMTRKYIPAIKEKLLEW